MAWLAVTLHSLTFHRKAYKYAQEKIPFAQFEFVLFIEKKNGVGGRKL
jgi:hypothetical protein